MFESALNRCYTIEKIEHKGNNYPQRGDTNDGECPAKMAIDKKRLRKMFPHLTQELEAGDSRITITSVRSDLRAGETASSRKFANYMPDVIDFLRRCDTERQAEEIICYLEGRREISRDYARRLKKQLKEKGVRSFGSKKEDDYYLKKDGF
jgi:hypothetical protein